MKKLPFPKFGIVLKTFSTSFAVGAVFLAITLFLLPLINNELNVAVVNGGLYLISFLALSYLVYLGFTLFLALKVRRTLTFLITSANAIASGNLEIELEHIAPSELGEAVAALDNLRISMRDRIALAQEERDRAEAILFNVGEGVFAVNLRGEIIIFNQIAEKLVGINREQILGQKYDQVLQFYNYKTKESYGQFINKVLLEGESVSLPPDTILITGNKAEIPVAVNSSPIRNHKGVIGGGIVVFRDISHEKEIEEIRTDLISIASHQLRTPLSEIKGLVSLLSDGIAGPLSERQKEYLNLLTVANERMIHLVNDLLNISRIEQGRLQLNFQQVDLGTLTSEVFKGLEIKSSERQQVFVLTIDPNLPQVTADPDKTKEIISNLIDNALKYTYEKGKIQVRVTSTNDGVWVLVKDGGVGVPKSKQKDLFQKFSRVENPLSKMTTGTGLGLYAAKQLVERQNGKIWFESEEGKGSTFGFVLPATKVNEK